MFTPTFKAIPWSDHLGRLKVWSKTSVAPMLWQFDMAYSPPRLETIQFKRNTFLVASVAVALMCLTVADR